MRLILIGAPGSGKTTLARRLSKFLKIPHIEADTIFWSGQDLRKAIDVLTDGKDWILEGHLSKHHDITFPKADAFLVITGSPMVYLRRSLMRDLFAPSKFWFNLRNHSMLEKKRQDLLRKIKPESKKVFYLENLAYCSEGELEALAEALKSSSAKA